MLRQIVCVLLILSVFAQTKENPSENKKTETTTRQPDSKHNSQTVNVDKLKSEESHKIEKENPTNINTPVNSVHSHEQENPSNLHKENNRGVKPPEIQVEVFDKEDNVEVKKDLTENKQTTEKIQVNTPESKISVEENSPHNKVSPSTHEKNAHIKNTEQLNDGISEKDINDDKQPKEVMTNNENEYTDESSDVLEEELDQEEEEEIMTGDNSYSDTEEDEITDNIDSVHTEDAVTEDKLDEEENEEEEDESEILFGSTSVNINTGEENDNGEDEEEEEVVVLSEEELEGMPVLN